MDELSPAMELAFDYGRQLRAVQSDHELLKYLDENMSPALDREFTKRFWNKPFPMEGQPGHLINATIWANYAAALKQAADGGPFLADFLARELKDYVTLDGKPINYSTSPNTIARGDEDFGLNIRRDPPQQVYQYAVTFYEKQRLETKVRTGPVNDTMQVKQNGHNVKYVVITKRHDGRHVEVSVRRVT